MNCKLGLTLSVAGAIAASTVLATAPAQALTIGSQLSFFWSADAEAVEIDFKPLVPGLSLGAPDAGFGEFLVDVPGSTGDFASLPLNDPLGNVLTIGTIQDLFSFDVPSGGISNFISFQGADPKFNFTLTSFSYIPAGTGFQGYTFEGVFGDGSLATGSLSTSTPVSLPGNQSYAAFIKVIPTPALLPGLVAMSAAALKRKSKTELAAQSDA